MQSIRKRRTRENGLEVHEHCIISGPRSRWSGAKIVHSHEGGDARHQHPDCGPASFVIDKDEWFATTGLRGGGRKKFTARPTGEQLPIAELADWQKSFEIIVCASPANLRGPDNEFNGGAGPGISPAMRMILACDMECTAVRDGNDSQAA